MGYVYLLNSIKDGKGYIGSTINLQHRYKEHCEGKVVSTRHRRPLELVGYQIFETIEEAAKFETKYKHSHDALKRAIKSGKFKMIKRDVV